MLFSSTIWQLPSESGVEYGKLVLWHMLVLILTSSIRIIQAYIYRSRDRCWKYLLQQNNTRASHNFQVDMIFMYETLDVEWLSLYHCWVSSTLLSLVEHWLTVNPYRLSKLLNQYRRFQEHVLSNCEDHAKIDSCTWSTFQRGKGTTWPCHYPRSVKPDHSLKYYSSSTDPSVGSLCYLKISQTWTSCEAKTARRVNYEFVTSCKWRIDSEPQAIPTVLVVVTLHDGGFDA